MLNRRDRGLARAIGVVLALGAVCAAVAVVTFLTDPDARSSRGRSVLVDAGAAAVIFIGFAVAEIVHRVRRGPQAPGRHSRD